MKILNKKKSIDITQYTFGESKQGFMSFFYKRKPYERYWVELMECYCCNFKKGTIDMFLEIKHPLGTFDNFEKEFQNVLNQNSIYYKNESGFIVIRDVEMETLKKFLIEYYDQGLIVLMSYNKIDNSITNGIIKRINSNNFNLNESIRMGFNLAVEFNFPSGKEIYISTNLEDSFVEFCFESIDCK